MNAFRKTAIVACAAVLTALGAMPSATEAAQRHNNGMTEKYNNAQKYNNHQNRRHSQRRYYNRSIRFGLPSIYFYSGDNTVCSYSYRRWQNTGSRYWRNRYYDCRNG